MKSKFIALHCIANAVSLTVQISPFSVSTFSFTRILNNFNTKLFKMSWHKLADGAQKKCLLNLFVESQNYLRLFTSWLDKTLVKRIHFRVLCSLSLTIAYRSSWNAAVWISTVECRSLLLLLLLLPQTEFLPMPRQVFDLNYVWDRHRFFATIRLKSEKAFSHAYMP